MKNLRISTDPRERIAVYMEQINNIQYPTSKSSKSSGNSIKRTQSRNTSKLELEFIKSKIENSYIQKGKKNDNNDDFTQRENLRKVEKFFAFKELQKFKIVNQEKKKNIPLVSTSRKNKSTLRSASSTVMKTAKKRGFEYQRRKIETETDKKKNTSKSIYIFFF